MGRLRRARRAQRRHLRWLLVHRLPPGVCTARHQPSGGQRGAGTDRSRPRRARHRRGRARQGWCQYGSPEELSNIKREHDKDPPPRPDWRITCIYVDKKHRGQGIARAVLEGALDQIAHRGLVQAISEVTAGRQAQGRFLFSATVELFEQYGFTRSRQVGKYAWIVSGPSTQPDHRRARSSDASAQRQRRGNEGLGLLADEATGFAGRLDGR